MVKAAASGSSPRALRYLLKDVWDAGNFIAVRVEDPAPGNLIRALHSYRRRTLRRLSTLDKVQQEKPGMCWKVAEPLNPMTQMAKFQEVYA